MTKSLWKLFVCIRSASGFNSSLISCLDLQQKRHKSDIRDIRWHLVVDCPAPEDPALLQSPEDAAHGTPFTPQVPTVRTTCPEEDLLSIHDSNIGAKKDPPNETLSCLPSANHPNYPDLTRLSRPSQEHPNVLSVNGGLRRFHFIKNTSVSPSTKFNPATGAQRHKKSRRCGLPVFIENTKSILRPKGSRTIPSKIANASTENHVGSLLSTLPNEERTRRKPLASTAERKWRDENWNRSVRTDDEVKGGGKVAKSIDEPSSQWDPSSELLAEQLQQFPLRNLNSIPTSTKSIRNPSHLKVQPQPPKPRQTAVESYVEVSSEDESMKNAIDLDEDNDNYVYDTYVRSIGQQADASVISLEGIDAGHQKIDLSKTGVLIIAEEDHEEWETFAEIDRESDKDWNSEEEDENGLFSSE